MIITLSSFWVVGCLSLFCLVVFFGFILFAYLEHIHLFCRLPGSLWPYMGGIL